MYQHTFSSDCAVIRWYFCWKAGACPCETMIKFDFRAFTVPLTYSVFPFLLITCIYFVLMVCENRLWMLPSIKLVVNGPNVSQACNCPIIWKVKNVFAKCRRFVTILLWLQNLQRIVSDLLNLVLSWCWLSCCDSATQLLTSQWRKSEMTLVDIIRQLPAAVFRRRRTAGLHTNLRISKSYHSRRYSLNGKFW